MNNLNPNNKDDYSTDADNTDLAELIKRDNEITYFKQELEKTSGELEKERELRKQKDKVLNEKDKMILDLAKTLKDSGKSTKEIQNLTNISKEVIENL